MVYKRKKYEPQKLNTVDFDRIFRKDSRLIKAKKMLEDSIRYDAKNYLTYADNLELWHYMASICDGMEPGIELHTEKEYEKCKTN